MFILAIVQTIFAAGFLITGLIALFGIGLTGLLLLIPGAIFAALAALTLERSRAAIGVALSTDALLAYFAVRKLEGLSPASSGPMDYLLPALILALILLALGAVARDWQALRAARWFSA